MLDPEMRDRLLERWETAVKESPREAWQAGPPNWLVVERTKPGEKHEAAAERVKREYFGVQE